MIITTQDYLALVGRERAVARGLSGEALAHRLIVMGERPRAFPRHEREALLYEAARRIRGVDATTPHVDMTKRR
jgi:hypothetical protein